MDVRRRIKALEKKLGVEEPRDVTVEFPGGWTLTMSSDKWRKVWDEATGKKKAKSHNTTKNNGETVKGASS